MKTFIYSNLEKLKRYKLTIDIKFALCKTAWLIPNDEGKRIEYIFKNDGSIVMSSNGIVSYGEWTFEPLTKALFIKCNDVVMNFKPVFYDNNLLALNLDGTNSLLFLVNQTSHSYANSIDYSRSVEYLKQKENESDEDRRKKEREEKIKKLDYLNSYAEIEKQYKIYYNLHKSDIDLLNKKRKLLIRRLIIFIFILIVINLIMNIWLKTEITLIVFLTSIVVGLVAYYYAMIRVISLYKENDILLKSDFCDSSLENRLKLVNMDNLLL